MNDKLLYDSIGKLIKKERQKKGLTQEELASITNYSLSFIANIESTTHQSFSINTLYNIAKALNISIHNLLPEYQEIKNDNYSLTCINCQINVDIPKEVGKIIKEINEISKKEIFYTCPNCQHKKMYLNNY